MKLALQFTIELVYTITLNLYSKFVRVSLFGTSFYHKKFIRVPDPYSVPYAVNPGSKKMS